MAGVVSFVDNFYNELFVLVVASTLLCPPKFCNLPYISIIYLKLHMSCFKIFSYILQVFCEMFGVVLLVTFIVPVIYPLFIAVVMVSCLCVYLSC